MKLLEVSFMFGPAGRSLAARMIHKIRTTPSQMQGLTAKELLGYTVASQSLTPSGRDQLKQSTTIDCSLVESENQKQKEINESALKILILFVDSPLTGR